MTTQATLANRLKQDLQGRLTKVIKDDPNLVGEVVHELEGFVNLAVKDVVSELPLPSFAKHFVSLAITETLSEIEKEWKVTS